MTTNLPVGEPATLYNTSEMIGQFVNKQLTASDVRNNSDIQNDLNNGSVSKTFIRGARGLPFYFGMTSPKEDSSAIAFERNFNPMLKRDSDYFKAVGNVISCVEKNASKNLSEEQQDSVCKTQIKEMRLAAFNNELLFHNVNKRLYMDLLMNARGEAPY